MLVLGSGTMPGSDTTARRCEMVNRKMTVLNSTTLKAPHNLEMFETECGVFNREPVTDGSERQEFPDECTYESDMVGMTRCLITT